MKNSIGVAVNRLVGMGLKCSAFWFMLCLGSKVPFMEEMRVQNCLGLCCSIEIRS